MSRIFLDTSAYSAFKRGHTQVRSHIREAELIYVNPVVLGELQAGFLAGSRLVENLSELERFLASPLVAVLAVDEDTAERYSVIHATLREVGRPIPTNDVWIAASAMQAESVLVTTDPHFGRVPHLKSVILPVA